MSLRVLRGLGLTAVLASAAQAQVLHYTGPAAANYNAKTAYFVTGPDAGAPAFQVWCVDQNSGITSGNNYLVTYTRLNGPSFAGTVRGQAGDNYATAQSKYTRAAWLASTMGGSAADPNDPVKNKQFAIWAIMNGKTAVNSECSLWGSGPDHTAECNLATVQQNLSDATANELTIDKSEWVVLTGREGVDPYNPNAGEWKSAGMQELIARCYRTGRTQAAGMAAEGLVLPPSGCDDPWNPPNEETTPEPATMSLLALGLAGMAGKSLRRRKK